MATIDDVMDKLDDVLDKLDDVLEKVEEVKSQNSVVRECTTCNGAGILTYRDDAQPGVILTKTCNLCSGSKYIPFGKLEEAA